MKIIKKKGMMIYNLKQYKNIYINYFYLSLSSLNFSSAIWVVYMISKGMNLLQVGIAEALLHITMFITEIPTGLLADIIGRKVLRLISVILSIISTIIMITSDSFFLFCIAFIITGLGFALDSGCGEALIYDSLKLVGQENEYKKIAGTNNLIIYVCQATALLFGAFL